MASDPYGISDGIKSATDSINSVHDASKNITKTIQNVQHDAVETAKERTMDKVRKEQYVEYSKEMLTFAALDEYDRLKNIIQEEAKAKREFMNKYGEKEWAKVEELKTVIEKEKKNNRDYYGHEKKDVQRVQILCWIAAFIVTIILGKTFHLFPILLG